MVNPTIEPRFDTRGLPEGYDPHKFYEYHIDKNAADARGLELFVYRLMPYSLIKSIAFAIDPLSSFKTSTGVVTPANRTRYRGTNNVLLTRTLHLDKWSDHTASVPNWDNIPGRWGPLATDPTVHFHDSGNQGNQVALLDKIIDTTKRTRLVNSDTGTLDKFSSVRNVPGRQFTTIRTSYVYKDRTPPSLPEIAIDREVKRYSIVGPASTLSKSTFDNLVLSEHTIANTLMAKQGLGMYTGLLPEHRDYTFFRNLVELRDIHRTIISLHETTRNLRNLESVLKIPSKLVSKIRSFKTVIDDIPKEYIAYHFGWKQTVKDTIDLLKAPGKISKKINFLLARNGKDTTYRTKRKFSSASTGVSGFSHDVLTGEYSALVSSRIERETELRMVVNANFRFPDVNLPSFKHHLYADKLGIYPRITDIYNLVPWTWLNDWFTGLGNYIDIIDTMNHDKSLINWGFLTADVRGKLTTDYESKSDSHDTGQFNSDPGWDFVTTQVNRHTSVLDFSFQLRKDIASILSVQKTSDVSSLTTYQASILAALIQQAGKLRSSPAFR
ncbi:maturation protein [ssRNA phage Gephyllon.1_24]|uniref:Maturation protein n=2 Tax=Leviviricetes TaxID=2842243 RepID=A0A8S5KZ48_9VIRU|nr:maturation protein [ssRNA phage Gephyllon.1_24]QDH90075.1 MAG: hypothetical protein H1BulkLitter6246_000001 [Leviviridae sp.]DAD50447.1 TPA_asm: maturation protein [ssRNA phage Gephyllon.1_24]